MATFRTSSASGPASLAAFSAETREALFDELSKIAYDLSPEEQAYLRSGLADHVNKEYAAGRVVGAKPGEKSPFAKPELSPREKEKQKLKRLAKAGLITAAGGTAGYGLGLLAEEGIKRTFGKKWAQTPPSTKMRFLPIATGALGLAAAAAQQYTAREYQRRVEGEDE